jgi:hypothetical protein
VIRDGGFVSIAFPVLRNRGFWPIKNFKYFLPDKGPIIMIVQTLVLIRETAAAFKTALKRKKTKQVNGLFLALLNH